MLRHYDPDAKEWYTAALSEGEFSTKDTQWYVVASESRSMLGIAWTHSEWEWSDHVEEVLALCRETGGEMYGACGYGAKEVKNIFAEKVIDIRNASCLVHLDGREDLSTFIGLRRRVGGHLEWAVMSCGEAPVPAQGADKKRWIWNLDHLLMSANVLRSIVSSAEGHLFIAAQSSPKVKDIIRSMVEGAS